MAKMIYCNICNPARLRHAHIVVCPMYLIPSSRYCQKGISYHYGSNKTYLALYWIF